MRFLTTLSCREQYEYAMMTGELVEGTYQEDGHTRDSRSGPAPLLPARVLFDVAPGLRERIRAAQQQALEAVNDFDLRVHLFTEYGKGFMKRLGVSPDAYLQMALQITYFRNVGRFHLTYESAMARLFKHGRTETIRSVSEQSVDFVRSFVDDNVPADVKLQKLRAASTRHTSYTVDAMTGKGVDRHLFALYIVSQGKSIDSPFLNAALSEPWRLSTSQQPQQQTKRWDLKNPEHVKQMGAGGGFGPVCDDGCTCTCCPLSCVLLLCCCCPLPLTPRTRLQTASPTWSRASTTWSSTSPARTAASTPLRPPSWTRLSRHSTT